MLARLFFVCCICFSNFGHAQNYRSLRPFAFVGGIFEHSLFGQGAIYKISPTHSVLTLHRKSIRYPLHIQWHGSIRKGLDNVNMLDIWEFIHPVWGLRRWDRLCYALTNPHFTSRGNTFEMHFYDQRLDLPQGGVVKKTDENISFMGLSSMKGVTYYTPESVQKYKIRIKIYPFFGKRKLVFSKLTFYERSRNTEIYRSLFFNKSRSLFGETKDMFIYRFSFSLIKVYEIY